MDEERLTDYSEDGVDLTLIRWMLSLTPAERLQFLQQQVNAILKVRELNGVRWFSRGAARYDARVEFLVVGGVAAVLQGAPVHTYDVDVLFSRSRENIDRLLPVLNTVDAYYRMQPERRIVPTASHLASPGHQNLITRFGQFDLLGTVGRDLGYEDLLAHSVEMDIGEGVVVRVLALEKLIEIKEELGQEKDRAVLPILRRTAEAKRRTKSI